MEIKFKHGFLRKGRLPVPGETWKGPREKVGLSVPQRKGVPERRHFLVEATFLFSLLRKMHLKRSVSFSQKS